MMQYSVQPRDQAIVKNISKNLSGKCSQKLDGSKQSEAHAIVIEQ